MALQTSPPGYLLDLAPPAQRPLYLGFTNTVFGVAIFALSMGGLIVEWAGFAVLLIVSASLWALALLLSLLLAEPRDRMEQLAGAADAPSG